jgi:hypothetical protein
MALYQVKSTAILTNRIRQGVPRADSLVSPTISDVWPRSVGSQQTSSHGLMSPAQSGKTLSTISMDDIDFFGTPGQSIGTPVDPHLRAWYLQRIEELPGQYPGLFSQHVIEQFRQGIRAAVSLEYLQHIEMWMDKAINDAVAAAENRVHGPEMAEQEQQAPIWDASPSPSLPSTQSSLPFFSFCSTLMIRPLNPVSGSVVHQPLPVGSDYSAEVNPYEADHPGENKTNTQVKQVEPATPVLNEDDIETCEWREAPNGTYYPRLGPNGAPLDLKKKRKTPPAADDPILPTHASSGSDSISSHASDSLRLENGYLSPSPSPSPDPSFRRLDFTSANASRDMFDNNTWFREQTQEPPQTEIEYPDLDSSYSIPTRSGRTLREVIVAAKLPISLPSVPSASSSNEWTEALGNTRVSSPDTAVVMETGRLGRDRASCTCSQVTGVEAANHTSEHDCVLAERASLAQQLDSVHAKNPGLFSKLDIVH